MLRNLTSIDLFNHQEFYASHPYVLDKLHVFESKNTAFSATLSDSGLGDGYDRKNPSSRVVCIKREAIRNATVGTYSSLVSVCFIFGYWHEYYFSLSRKAWAED